MKSILSKLIEIPEEALQELLVKSGESEDFLNTQKDKIEISRSYRKREKGAYWSIWWLAISTLVSLISFCFERDLEDFISVICLGIMTYVEIKVRK